MALQYNSNSPSGASRVARGIFAQRQTNAQPAVTQANQRAQRPFFQAQAPGGAAGSAGQRQPQVPPMEGTLPPKPFLMPGFVPDAWNLHAQAQAAGEANPPEMPDGGSPPTPTGGGGAIPGGGGVPATGGAHTYAPHALSLLAEQLVRQLSELSNPNTAGLKEQQKDTLTALKQQGLDAVRQSAASRGVAGGGNLGAQEANTGDAFAGMLTGAYRDIDQQAATDRFSRLGEATRLAGDLGAGAEQRRLAADLGYGGLDLNQQQLRSQIEQFARAMGLQEATATSAQDNQFIQLLLSLLS